MQPRCPGPTNPFLARSQFPPRNQITPCDCRRKITSMWLQHKALFSPRLLDEGTNALLVGLVEKNPIDRVKTDATRHARARHSVQDFADAHSSQPPVRLALRIALTRPSGPLAGRLPAAWLWTRSSYNIRWTYAWQPTQQSARYISDFVAHLLARAAENQLLHKSSLNKRTRQHLPPRELVHRVFVDHVQQDGHQGVAEVVRANAGPEAAFG